MAIHPTAIISENATIDESTSIGPFVIIEGNAKIGKNNNIMANAFVGTGTTIGDDNEIHMGAIVGHAPQDKAFNGEESFLKVGNNNVIREYVTIHRGTTVGSCTNIGNNCLLMGGCHIAHDCQIKDRIIIANMAGLAGYVEVDSGAVISGGVMIHQFVKVGRLAMIAGNSRLSMDVPPFVIAAERNQIWGINVIGLRRSNMESQVINELRETFRILFKTPEPRSELIKKIREMEFKSEEVQEIVRFVESSKRGICKAETE